MMQTQNVNNSVRRSHNLRNTLHTLILMLVAAVIMGVMAYSLFGVIGLIGAAIFGAVGIAGAGRVSPKMVLGLYKARPLEPHEAPQLHEMVEELARRAELPSIPKLHYVPTQLPNAFAVGRKDDSAIAVTDGLLRMMNLRQIQGILAHETAHIMNGDLRVMGMADVMNRITSTLSWLGMIGVPVVFGAGVNVPLLGLGLMIFAPMIGGMVQLGISRAREYDADLDGATLTGDPEGLASALRVLEEKMSGKMGSVFLPGSRMPQPSLMRTHPKTEDRVARLNALKINPNDQIVIRPATEQPATSIVPTVSAPRIRWHRMGVYY
jgi:heat shock protein HtpX